MDTIKEILLNDLRVEDISKKYTGIIEAIGFEAFKALIQYCGGCDPYIPNLNSILINVRNRHLIEEFDGVNLKQLARKYRISERYVECIIKGKYPKHSTKNKNRRG